LLDDLIAVDSYQTFIKSSTGLVVDSNGGYIMNKSDDCERIDGRMTADVCECVWYFEIWHHP
jgi:hypothetical protein